MLEIQTIDPYYNEKVYTKYSASSLSTKQLNAAEQGWLVNHNHTIRLGYLTSNLPYCDLAEDGSLRGLMTVLVRTFEEEFDIRVETIPFNNVMDLIQAACDDEIDLFGPTIEDYWLAEQYGLFATDHFASTNCILLYQGDYEEDMTRTISCYSGSAAQMGAASILFPDAILVECESMEDCLQAVLDGRAGCTIASSSALNLLLQYKAMDSLNMLELPAAADICLSTIRGNSQLLNITNRVIFTSSDDLTGVALMENIRSDTKLTLLDFVQQYSLVVIGCLLCVIVLMIGGIVFYLCMFQRLTRMQTKNEELSQQAFRDSLTKVGNRAGYFENQEDLQKKIQQSEPISFALVVADVNGLKIVNDTMGHEVGDMLIRNASKLICRIYDHSPVYRIGGDEFVVVLTGTDYAHRDELLAELARNARPFVDRQQVEMGGSSIAFGMAVYDSSIDANVDEVFDRADKAMYQCKRQMKLTGITPVENQ